MAEETLELILSLRDEATSKLAAAGGQLATLNDQSTRAAATVQTLADKYRLAGQSQDLVAKSVTDLTGKQAKLESTIEATSRALEQERAKADSNATTIAMLERSLDKLQQQARSTSDAIERKVISIEKASVSMRQLEQRTLSAADAMRREDTAMTESKGSLGGLADGLLGVAKAYVGVEAVRKVVQWGKEGAAIEGVEEAFDNLARKSGTSSTAYLAALKQASAGTISETNLMIGANKAVLLAGDRLAKDVPQLLEIARAASKATGEDINFMFDSLVTGLARNSKMIIDNLGITVDVAKANDNYAKSIGKTADALTEQERAMAFQAEVMRQGKQMIDDVGQSSDTNAEKIGRANAKWENFLNDLKKGTGVALAWTITNDDADAEVQRIGALGQEVLKLNQAVASGQMPWTAYSAKMTELGAAAAILGPYQVAVAQSLVETGMAADAASESVRVVNAALINDAASAGMSAEAIAQVITQSQQIAAVSPEAAATVQELTLAFMDSTMSSADYTHAMSELTIETEVGAGIQMLMAEQTANLTAIQEYQTMVLLGQADANLLLSDIQYESLQLSAQAQLQAESERQQQELLTEAVFGVADGKYMLGDASIDLSNKLGISQLKALELIKTFTHLYMVLAQGKGGSFAKNIDIQGLGQSAIDSMIRDVENAGTSVGKAVGRATNTGTYRVSRPDIYAPKKKGGGSSRNSGQSASQREAEQRIKQAEQTESKIAKAKEDFQEKAERLTRDHYATVRKIEDDYHRKALAAEQAFNRQKFADQADFLESVASMHKDDRAEALRKQTEAWDKAQAMAQAGRAKEADAYLKAAEEEIEADQQRTDRMRQLRQQLADETADLTAADRADLEEQLRLLAKADQIKDDLAAKRLSDLETANDSLKAERDEALASENADYTEAQAKLRDDFADTMRGILDKQTEQLQAHQTWADATIALYGLVASAASNAANAVGQAPTTTAAPGEDASFTTQDKVEASYALGTGDMGLTRDMVVQAHAREIIVDPTRSDGIRKAGGIDYLLKLSDTERVNRSRADRLPTVTPTPLVQPAPRDYPPPAAAAGPTNVAIQAGGLTLAQLEALLRRILAQNNQGLGQQSQVRQRLASPRK